MIPKFRAWIIKKQPWNYNKNKVPYMVYDIEYTYDNENGDSFGEIISEHKEGNLILMQSTGLKDKNGKEIFEGDIIRYNYHVGKDSTDFRGVIEYHIEKQLKSWDIEKIRVSFILRGIDIDGSKWYTEFPCIEDIEVIGNIYENPELLEAKE